MKEIKIILLAPVVFDKHNNDLVEQVILKVDADNSTTKFFSDKEWKALDNDNGYLKTLEGPLDIQDAIDRERNLDPKILKELIKPYQTKYDNTDLTLDAKLIVNEKHNFLMLFEFTFSNISFDYCSEFITKVMDDRNLFVVTNTEKFYENVKQKSIEVINRILKNILLVKHELISEQNFTMDSSYPLIFINGFDKEEDLYQLFTHEENIEQIHNSLLSKGSKIGSFIHIGWNYGIVKEQSKNVAQKYLCMLIVMQLNYYLLRFYKNYFQKKIQRMANKHTFKEEEIKNFDKLKILYHKEHLAYKTYKSGLYPKFYEEIETIEILWHMTEDIEYIEKTFQVQNEYMNKHFQLDVEKTNRNLNYGIAIIGLIQIFAIYGIFNDYVSLKSNVKFPEYTEYASISIASLFIGIILIGIIYKLKRKKYE